MRDIERERERERLRGELERGTLDKKAIKFIHGISFWSEMIFFLSDNAVSQIMSFLCKRCPGLRQYIHLNLLNDIFSYYLNSCVRNNKSTFKITFN